MTTARHQNRGLRKVCSCPRRGWAKCPHSWHFNFKLPGGPSYRFSIDAEAGKHIDSKTQAEALADGYRIAIRAGTFRRRAEVPALPAAAPAPEVLTLAAFFEKYSERVTKPLSTNDRGCLAQLLAFEDLRAKPVASITEDDIEAFFTQLRAAGRAASTRNKHVQAVTAMFRWAAKKGYLPRSPIADSDSIKREKHAKRARRLEPDEEGRLLAAAAPHLQRLIVGALETGCRRGELLSLTWRDVNLARREISIRPENSKTRTGRVLPVSTRLAAVLEMARLDPAGEEFGPTAFVFGDAVGRRVATVKRAWETAVVKAAGHVPEWTAQNALAPASKAVFKAVDLHFHDLRHEAGSRLLEAGWPLHHVQHMLGHADVSQTSTYLNATRIGLQESMRRLDAAGCNPVASEGAIEHPPVRNANESEAEKPLIN
jgi:integrase